MPHQLAQRLNAVAPSATIAMNARAAEMRGRGLDVFNFGVGEPDFEPPAHVLDAAKRSIDEQRASKYTAVGGVPPLKQAICDRTERVRGFRPTPEQVTVTVGAKHALFNLALALYEPGDEIVIPAPYWVSYPEQVRLCGATPVIVPTEEASGWLMTKEALASALTPRTKAVILCTPSNPTGAAYDEAHLRPLLDAVRAHDCWIIADEIYSELVYDGFRHVSPATIVPELRDRLVLVDGVSKAYAMTGWRIGWSIAPRALAKACETIQSQSTTNPTAAAQYAAISALTGSQDDVERMRLAFEERRNVMVEGLSSLPGVRCRKPEGAFYAFADVRGLYGRKVAGKELANDEDAAFFFLDHARVVGVPGSAFGAPGYLRLSYATSVDRIRAGIESMRTAIASATQ